MTWWENGRAQGSRRGVRDFAGVLGLGLVTNDAVHKVQEVVSSLGVAL